MFNSPASFSDEQMFSILESTLDKYSYTNENSITGLSELDGFLTAIVSTPSMIMPNRWLPEIWRESQPEWESQKEFEDFIHAAVQLMNDRALMLILIELLSTIDHHYTIILISKPCLY